MNTLEHIVARKRKQFGALAPDRRSPPVAHHDARGMARALATGNAVIAEVKRKSPSGGSFPHTDLVAVAQAYERAGARAISVLTDAEDFGGSLQDLRAIRAAVGLPVLRKDFLIDPSEVFESVAAGADAVLLIAEVLSDRELTAMLGAVESARCDALVEAHTHEAAERALKAGARMVGINNRNLQTLQTSTDTALQLIPQLRGRAGVLVAESGIRTHADFTAAIGAGAHAVLVGEVLLRAADPGLALRSLIEPGRG